MERKIGEVFNFEGKELVVEESNNLCKGCVFETCNFEKCSEIEKVIGSCYKESRSDGISVIFKYTNMTKSKLCNEHKC